MEMTAVMDRPPFPPRDAESLEITQWLGFQPPAQPEPAPVAETPTPAPVAEPVKPQPPNAEELAEKRRTAAADKLRRKAEHIRIVGRRWTFAVILISTVVTLFGSGNSHQVYLHHDTTNPWAWLPYPALEAALIVEIQVGATLAEHKVPVKFWGAALRFVTAFAAVTVCIYGPAENGDWGGAGLHALGPVVQFFLAEFLARAREHFRQAVDALLGKADGRENAVRPSDERRTEAAKKAPKKTPSAPRPRADERTKTADEPQTPPTAADAGPDDDEVLVRAHAAADELERTDQRLNRDNLVRAIRAAGGTIQNKDAGRILAQVRAERGGPDLHTVREKGA